MLFMPCIFASSRAQEACFFEYRSNQTMPLSQAPCWTYPRGNVSSLSQICNGSHGERLMSNTPTARTLSASSCRQCLDHLSQSTLFSPRYHTSVQAQERHPCHCESLHVARPICSWRLVLRCTHVLSRLVVVRRESK